MFNIQYCIFSSNPDKDPHQTQYLVKLTGAAAVLCCVGSGLISEGCQDCQDRGPGVWAAAT